MRQKKTMTVILKPKLHLQVWPATLICMLCQISQVFVTLIFVYSCRVRSRLILPKSYARLDKIPSMPLPIQIAFLDHLQKKNLRLPWNCLRLKKITTNCFPDHPWKINFVLLLQDDFIDVEMNGKIVLSDKVCLNKRKWGKMHVLTCLLSGVRFF